ncbi:MAG: ABC transporter ATP-binding protein [Clostridia bacterium]|nr:ABC transporter ATP-binding protein [Clostridia bacterium]
MIFGKHINRYYLKYLPQLLIGVLALLLVDIFQLKVPELYGAVIDGVRAGYVVENGVEMPFDLVYITERICMPLLFVALALVFGRFLWRVTIFGAAMRTEADLRREMFARARELSVEYYQRNRVGNLMSLFTNDLSTVQECFGSGVLMFFDALLLGALAITKMLRMDAHLTLLSLIPMAFLLVIGTIVGRYMRSKWRVRQEAFSALSEFAQENFSGIAVIKAFVKEFLELMAFRKINKDNEKANVDFTRASTLLHIFVTLFVESVICIILGFGGYLVYRGDFTSGELIEFISYFNSIVWPVMAISQLVDLRSRGVASLGRVSELLDARPAVTDGDGVKALTSPRGEIEMRDLTFRYPDADYDALLSASFKIEAGENVGIIGATGSGKTTLVDLILRIYNVPRGTLFIDGTDVNDLSIRSVREAIAYVPQDNFLFSDTIENNIAFSEEGADLERVRSAARLADIDGNIMEFGAGYSTVLGERGVTASGGQKQRISIARALMKDSPILILDDSVSAVDLDTERNIIENLERTRKGRTTILIAHRVSTVSGMDKIIFLDEGRVAAVGSHDELLLSCPKYRKTVELQRLEEERGK